MAWLGSGKAEIQTQVGPDPQLGFTHSVVPLDDLPPPGSPRIWAGNGSPENGVLANPRYEEELKGRGPHLLMTCVQYWARSFHLTAQLEH